MGKLTAIQIKNAKVKEKSYKLSDGYGLYFHVSNTGKRTWRYRFKIVGTESTFVLGEYPGTSLSEAREELAEARKLVRAGINPAQKRREAREALIKDQEAKENTFEKIALEWCDKQKEEWSTNHATAVHRSFNKNVYGCGELTVYADEYSKAPDAYESIRVNTLYTVLFRVELKPEIGDDFPAVLRQMKATRSNILVIRNYNGTGATYEAFLAFFNSQNIKVFKESEIEQAEVPGYDEVFAINDELLARQQQ